MVSLLSAEAVEALKNYRWPGNVRELRNIVIRLGTKYPGATVTRRQLDDELETQLSAETLSDQSPTLTDEYIVGKIEAGEFTGVENLVFLHTGGTASLPVYGSAILS